MSIKKLSTTLVLSTALICNAWSASGDLAASPVQQAKQFMTTRSSAKEMTYWNDYQDAKRRNTNLTILDYVHSIADTKPEAAGWFMVSGGKKGFANRQATEEESRKMHEVVNKLAANIAKTDDSIPVFAEAITKTIVGFQKQSLTKGLEVYGELAKQHDSPYKHLQGVLDAVDKLTRENQVIKAKLVHHEQKIDKLKVKNRNLTQRLDETNLVLEELRQDHEELRQNHHSSSADLEELKQIHSRCERERQESLRRQENLALERLNEINRMREEWSIRLRDEVAEAQKSTIDNLMPLFESFNKRADASDKRFFAMLQQEKDERLADRQAHANMYREKEQEYKENLLKKKDRYLAKMEKLKTKEQAKQRDLSEEKNELLQKIQRIEMESVQKDSTIANLTNTIRDLQRERDELQRRLDSIDNVSFSLSMMQHPNHQQPSPINQRVTNQPPTSHFIQQTPNFAREDKSLDEYTILQSEMIEGSNSQNGGSFY